MKGALGLVLAGVLLGALAGRSAAADEPLTIPVTIKDHKFVPSEIEVPAGKPVVLTITNQDATAEEFELHCAQGRESHRRRDLRHGAPAPARAGDISVHGRVP